MFFQNDQLQNVKRKTKRYHQKAAPKNTCNIPFNSPHVYAPRATAAARPSRTDDSFKVRLDAAPVEIGKDGIVEFGALPVEFAPFAVSLNFGNLSLGLMAKTIPVTCQNQTFGDGGGGEVLWLTFGAVIPLGAVKPLWLRVGDNKHERLLSGGVIRVRTEARFGTAGFIHAWKVERRLGNGVVSCHEVKVDDIAWVRVDEFGGVDEGGGADAADGYAVCWGFGEGFGCCWGLDEGGCEGGG